jgi:hypothetical protein
LLKNASFTEVTGTLPNDWTADASAIVAWSALDPRVGIGSGSIVVTTTKAEAVGVSQCVNARAGSTYDAVARSQLGSNTPSGLARVSIIFYSEGSCRGEPRSVYVSPFDGTTSSWRKLELLGARAPDDTSSLRLRLELQKLADVEAASVRFDDVLLKARD